MKNKNPWLSLTLALVPVLRIVGEIAGVPLGFIPEGIEGTIGDTIESVGTGTVSGIVDAVTGVLGALGVIGLARSEPIRRRPKYLN